jgi:hypothetical protein
VLVELGEGSVIGPDELVSWLEPGLLDARHGGVLQEGAGERQRNDGTHQRRKKAECRMQNGLAKPPKAGAAALLGDS